MRTWNKFFWLCLTGTVLLTVGVVFLPRYFSRSLDKRNLNLVEVAGRDEFSFLEPSNNGVLANERAFRNLTYSGDNLTLITSIEEPIRMNSELLDEVYNQAMSAAEYGMLPWIGGKYYKYESPSIKNVYRYNYWAEEAKFAKYYSLTYSSEDNPNNTEMLNFWYLRFSDDVNFDYYFIVNAVSYQIYYARIYNMYTDELIDNMDMIYKEVSSIAEAYTEDTYAASQTIENTYKVSWADINGNPYFDDTFSIGCMQYYESDSYGFVEDRHLYDKLGLTLLYYGSSIIYIEQSSAERSSELGYKGIEVGFQEVINKIDLLEK